MQDRQPSLGLEVNLLCIPAINILKVVILSECAGWCSRMQDGFLPQADIASDVKEFIPTGSQLTAEGLLAGFPCQVRV